MKTVLLCTICVILTASAIIYWNTSFSINREVRKLVEMDKELASPPHGAGPLVSIVWYKGIMWTPYKIFSDHRDIENIYYRLQYKGSQSKDNNKTSDFTQEDKLAFVYYSNKENSHWMKYMPFRIEDDVFYWPYGKDKKIARLLMGKEEWNPPFDYIDPSGMDYLNKKRKTEEKLGIADKDEKINQIRKPLALKDQLTPSDRTLLETCNAARQNLREIIDFSLRAEIIDDILLELNKNELSEKLVHAFVQLPPFITEDFGEIVKPESVEKIRPFRKKYDDEGLNREEQIELFQIHQSLNKQILDELQRRQDDFEKILRIATQDDGVTKKSGVGNSSVDLQAKK